MRFTLLFLVCICIISSAVAQDPNSNVVQPPAQSSDIPPPAASQPQPPPAASGSQQPVASGSGGGQQQPGVSGSNGIIATALPTGSAGGAQNNSIAALPKSASYGNSVYPGNAVFLAPKPSKSVSPLYRIDNRENVTFSWSYTNLLVQPEVVTLAAVAPNKVTYTIATVPGDQTTAVWQLKDVPAASPLMMGMYQIQLYDQRGATAIPLPGWLAPATRLSIAFYSAESYNPLTGADYCPTCFYNAGRRLGESIGPMMMAVGIACITTSFIVYGLLY